MFPLINEITATSSGSHAGFYDHISEVFQSPAAPTCNNRNLYRTGYRRAKVIIETIADTIIVHAIYKQFPRTRVLRRLRAASTGSIVWTRCRA